MKLWAFVAGVVMAGAAPASGAVINLGANFLPDGLNSKDQVVGDLVDNIGNNPPHAYEWSAGHLTALPEQANATTSDAFAINANGRVVGDDTVPSAHGSDVHAVYWDPSGPATQVGPISNFGPGGDFSVASGVDAAGDVAGATVGPSPTQFQITGFLARGGGSPGTVGQGEAGIVSSQVGAFTPDGSLLLGTVSTQTGTTSYLWSGASPNAPGTPLDLTPVRSGFGILGGSTNNLLLAMNDLASDGTVLGSKPTAALGNFYIRLPNGTETNITNFGGVNAVNAKHVVAGTVAVGQSIHAAIWKNGTVTDLNSLLPPNSGLILLDALAINDAGDVVGLGADTKTGDSVGFLLKVGYVVDSTGDQPDASTSDGACLTAANTCTLRAAIQQANADGASAADSISFDIPGGGVPTISPAGPLPALAVPISIDGTTQPGTPTGQPGVVIDGAAAGATADGLTIAGGASAVTGLIVDNFGGAGISLTGAGGDKLTGNWLGTHTGTSGGYVDAPNGVSINVAAPNATVGGTTTADRNVIADGGNPSAANNALDSINRDAPPSAAATEEKLLSYGAGVRIVGGGDGAVVSGNWLGLHPDGSRAGPDLPGIGHTGLMAGIQVAPGGAAVSGVAITGNVVTDSVIGIQAAAISGTASGVTIGRNVVGPDAAGTVADLIGNAVGIEGQGHVPGLVIGGAVGANTVQGNGLGVALGDTDGTVVAGNAIGTNANLFQLANSLKSQNPSPGLHNIIGVVLGGAAHTAVTDNRILGNVMGVLSASTAASRTNQITGNTIGYTPSKAPVSAEGLKVGDVGSLLGILDENAPGDTISGNTVELAAIGVLASGGHGVTIQGNTLTTNAFGLLAVQLAASAIQGNTFVRNLGGLVFIHGELTPTQLADIKADRSPVGPPDRAAAVTSPGSDAGLALMAPEGGVGLTDHGVTLASTTGLPAAAADRPSVVRAVTPGFGANITGNLIGTNASGTKLGNDIGAWLLADVTGSVAANTVAHNTEGGVWVGPSLAGHFPTVSLSRNSIFDNGASAKADGLGIGLGINLLGENSKGEINFDITPNHPGGSIPGPNGLQNYPVLAGAFGTSTHANVVGTLSSGSDHAYRTEFFASSACSPSGFGEGERYLSTELVRTDGTGAGSIDTHLILPKGLPVITATATGPDGTSEFSQCLKPGGSKTVDAAVAPLGFTPDASGHVTLSVWCLDGKPCAGTATLTATGPAKAGDLASSARATTLGRASFRGAHRKAVKVRIRLTKAGQKLLARDKRLNVVARIVLKGHRGRSATSRALLVLSARSRHH